ncbi:hypothetical protein QTI33_20755 [Variovorax sp. J22P271]|uniref:hypothetical protein n=1 Tax=Variovorax davisae TaxID=3053515 RepID=UPI002575CAD8|nr:hypothetical protein [Variovorax sp. J22P271]MDM0034580.1 hypothetical protein [Variovorax sp. J22P271]
MTRSHVYLDSKIRGAALQLVRYFDAGVFDRSSTVVMYRPYKESASFYEKLFDRSEIARMQLASLARIPSVDDSVVYYPFNAQSNCRIVAERGARHVFVTHGDSNKAASYKPIIRLYDYVVAAGMAGIDRYVQAGVFRREEAESGRVVRLGATFVGTSGYRPGVGGEPSCVLYAPTWEGGVESENYSSAARGQGLRFAAAHARAIGVRWLVVQPHPNLGHRLPVYRQTLYRQLRQLASEGFDIVLVDPQCSWRDRWTLGVSGGRKIEIVDAPPPFSVSRAFADLSAMETQLLNDGIEFRLFLQDMPSSVLSCPMLTSYYAAVGIFDWDDFRPSEPLCSGLRKQVRDYYISYSHIALASASPVERMRWLEAYVSKNEFWTA